MAAPDNLRWVEPVPTACEIIEASIGEREREVQAALCALDVAHAIHHQDRDALNEALARCDRYGTEALGGLVDMLAGHLMDRLGATPCQLYADLRRQAAERAE